MFTVDVKQQYNNNKRLLKFKRLQTTSFNLVFAKFTFLKCIERYIYQTISYQLVNNEALCKIVYCLAQLYIAHIYAQLCMYFNIFHPAFTLEKQRISSKENIINMCCMFPSNERLLQSLTYRVSCLNLFKSTFVTLVIWCSYFFLIRLSHND